MNNDWVRYIVEDIGLKDGALRGYPVVFMRSTRDHDTVKETFIQSWMLKFGVTDPSIVDVDSTHTGYNERPLANRVGFREAFREIGIG